MLVKYMPRPCKHRNLRCNPSCYYFKPRGIPLSMLEDVVLRADELEALNLSDLLGLYHEKSAGKMNVSRQTFDRILKSAHKKIADAIINGKAVLIEGGK